MIRYSVCNLCMYVRTNAHVQEERHKLLFFETSLYRDKAVAMIEVLCSYWPVITYMNVKGGTCVLISARHGWGGDCYYRETDL
jgi:hypothetical protein